MANAEEADPGASAWTVGPAPVPGLTVWCVRNHAKFVAVDGRILIVTSANMSISAEERNVELGLRLDDALLTRAVEERMRALEPLLYERVRPGTKPVDD
jgi:phospholipase D/transphosphatidylase